MESHILDFIALLLISNDYSNTQSSIRLVLMLLGHQVTLLGRQVSLLGYQESSTPLTRLIY